MAQSPRPANPLRVQEAVTATVSDASSEQESPATQTAVSDEPAELATNDAVSRVTRARLRARQSVRPASYSLFAGQNRTARRPAAEPRLVSQAPVLQDPPVVDQGLILSDMSDGFHEPVPQKGFLPKGAQKFPGGISLGKGKGGGDCCDGGGCTICLPCPRISLENLEVFGGVHGFTGPKNRGGSGSFGFDTGFNWGTELPCSCGCLGVQFGLRSSHSNFSGAGFTTDDRNQLFLTTGIFRRVDWGLQGGFVVDYLADDWYTETDLVQIRGELGWVYPHGHEIGFWFATHVEDDTQPSFLTGTTGSLTETWEATNLYAFYYRKQVCNAAGRFYAGFTNDNDGLIGADLRLPLSDSWAVESGFAYLIPEQGSTGAPGGGHEHESWNLGISLVWYPCSRDGCNYFRPLFNVADNGTFMVDRR